MKEIKKLALNKETLKELTSENVNEVNGGVVVTLVSVCFTRVAKVCNSQITSCL